MYRCGRGPLFFGPLGLGLEGGLHGLAGEFLGGGDGEGLDTADDLAVGGVIGGLLQLLGQEQGSLQYEGLEGRLGSESALSHGGSSGVGCLEDTAYGRKLPETIRAPAVRGRAVK